jgi:histone H1/5
MWAKSQRNKVDRALEAVARSRKALAFLEGPAKAYAEALASQKSAKDKKEPGDQEKLLTDAKTKLGSCSQDAKTFDADKATTSIGFTIDGKAQTPAQLVTLCDKVLKGVELDLKKVSAAAKAAKAKAEKEEKLAKEKAAKEAAAKKAQEAKAKAAAKKAAVKKK